MKRKKGSWGKKARIVRKVISGFRGGRLNLTKSWFPSLGGGGRGGFRERKEAL